MKLNRILPFAPFVAACSAIVIPQEEVLAEIHVEDNHRQTGWYDVATETKDGLLDSFKKHFEDVTETSKDAWASLKSTSRSALDDAFEFATEKVDTAEEKYRDATAELQSWWWNEGDAFLESFNDHHGHPPPPPHGPPDHDHPHHPPGHGPPHRGPPHHEGPPNQTVYQLISESKYTTKLAKLINKYDDLVDALNSTKANYTVFAPTDKAFEKIPDDAPEPSKEQLKALLSYHVVDGFYPAKRVLVSHTAPTLLQGEHLSSEPKPQRVAFKFSLRGLTVNYISRIIAANIFGTNGVIHGVDSIIIPPPSVVREISLFPGEFSTLELGLTKTGLLEKLNTTEHAGGTLFAPSNFAFQKLGPKINAFLFSSYGQKYLKALLEYHVVPENTLYSDAYYKAGSSEEDHGIPKGIFHVDLPTLLEDRSLAVDIARYGGFISIKVNAFARVTFQDGIAEDGVIHVVSDVIVPPKKLGGAEVEDYQGEDLTVEEFKARLEPFVAKGDL